MKIEIRGKQLHPDAPEWATDLLRASCTHSIGWRQRLIMAVQLLIGGPVRSSCAQWTEHEIGRTGGYLEVVTDWPRWLKFREPPPVSIQAGPPRV